MHFRNSSSLMTFTFTLVSRLLLVMHLEMQHAAAEAGRSHGQNSDRRQESAVESQSEKRGRGAGQSTNVGGGTSATVASDLSPAVEGFDYFQLPAVDTAADRMRKCYSATFSLAHVFPLWTNEAVCAIDKPQLSSFTTVQCKDWCLEQHSKYKQTQEHVVKGIKKDSCIQSFDLNIGVSYETYVVPVSCTINCNCTLVNHLERIKMPYLRINGVHYVLSPHRSKSYWRGVFTLLTNPPGGCHYEDISKKVAWISESTHPVTDKKSTIQWQVKSEVSKDNLPCDKIDWDWLCDCLHAGIMRRKEHLFRPGKCEEGHKVLKGHQRSKKKAKMADLDIADTNQLIEQCLAPAAHEITPANTAIYAGASTSGQAAWVDYSAWPTTAEQQLNPIEVMAWIAQRFNVEQDPQTGMPVDRNVLTFRSCNNPDLDNPTLFDQPHRESCDPPSHEGQIQWGQDGGSDDSQDDPHDEEADSYRRPLHFI